MESLPKCRLAMAAGAMSYRQAWIVADAVVLLDQQAGADVDAKVTARVATQSWDAFRRTLRRAVLAANPDLVLAEHAQSMKHRGADKFDFEGNVMSQVQITMSSIDAQTVWLGLDATAMSCKRPTKPLGYPMRGSTPTAPTRWSPGPTTRWPTRRHRGGTGAAPSPVHHRRAQPARVGRQPCRAARLRADPRRPGA